MEHVEVYIHYAALFTEIVGVATIIIGIFFAFARYAFFRKNSRKKYTVLRQELGKGILLGLEILVAADIIATVVTEPTMDRVLTLAMIVVIRTFLSLSLEVEITGSFPWQKRPND